MKYIFGLALLFVSYSTLCQDLRFDNKGRVLNVDTAANVSITNSFKNLYTEEDKRDIRKTLAAKLQVAINNIEDDSLAFKRLYNTLWNPAETQQIIDELKGFRQYLLDRNTHGWQPQNHHYIPSLDSINQLLDKEIFRFTSAIKKPKNRTAAIIADSVLKTLTIRYFNASVADERIDTIDMDIRYKNGWRQLEGLYKQLNADTSYLSNKNIIYNYQDTATIATIVKMEDSVVLISSLFDNNYIVTLLRNYSFFKKWLWYTDGSLQINPLRFTTPDKKYPPRETNTFDTISTLKNLTTEEEAQALIQTETNSKVINTVILPQVYKHPKFLYAFKPSSFTPYTFRYNAADNYQPIDNYRYDKLSNKQSVSFAVYNVPSKASLSFAQNGTAIEDKSGFENLLDDNVLAVAKTALTYYLPYLNGVPSKIPSVGITPSKVNTKVQLLNKNSSLTLSPVVNRHVQVQGHQTSWVDHLGDSSVSEAPESRDENEDGKRYIFLDSVKIPLTGEIIPDKKRIILASLIIKKQDTCIYCKPSPRSEAIDTFIEKDYCYTLNYEANNQASLNAGAENMLKRFQCFLQNAEAFRFRLQTIKDSLTDLLANKLYPIVAITNRSLPPDSLQELTDSLALYRTEVFTSDPFSDSAQKVVFTVNASEKKAVKDSSKPEDSIVAGSMKKTIKTAPLHYLDFSFGLSYTAKDYVVSNQSGASLPTASQGDRFNLIAGVHVFPLGLLNIDDGLFVRQLWRRISLFGAVGVNKPLDNIYAGLGYDIIPGLSTTAGWHFYTRNEYSIVRNQVTDQSSVLKTAGFYVSLNVEAVSFIKTLFSKQ